MIRITANQVKALRDKIGCGMMDSKKALEYGNGDEKIAIAYLKAKNLAVYTPKLTFDDRVKIFLEKGNDS